MKSLSLSVAVLLLVGCGANNSPPQAPLPGKSTSAALSTLETGAQVIQSRPPVEAISAYLDGFHFYNGDKNGQMEAHHYVTVLNEEVMQAVIYDGNTKDARLMGVEYIISERLFNTLPPEEKKLWHSHQYEVKSGSLVAPGLPAVADKALMNKIVNTYGKTWHTWHTDRDKTLPLGIPALMMGFTGEGQLDPRLLADRDRRLGIDTQEIKARRADIVAHPVVNGADAWQRGEVIQLKRVQGSGEHGQGDTGHFGSSEKSQTLKQP
ncbi:OBAP family protein [Leclercia adecarboxylata]|uniref:OBAP family protein n=1 Tax=Leclercia adecarboxylata TaxID=83655 RepID=UPI002DBFD4A9|nr:OBAP family protein [Leclercia adecarboxylata]MEB6378086.1 OBAP family protein [Leclercia adecarboxylata]